MHNCAREARDAGLKPPARPKRSMGERMRLKPGHHKQERHRKPSCASRDYWTTQFVGLISIALNASAHHALPNKVGRRCIVQWRIAGLGGCHAAYTGQVRDSGTPFVPFVARGFDGAIANTIFSTAVEAYAGGFNAFNEATYQKRLRERLEALPEHPDPSLG